ncbi:MAG: outer membrane beta-barrel protein, partial [Proteobacteria bacterium]|nr:outer membrane beta-barrel protein [Pseudomonadota bacterium]
MTVDAISRSNGEAPRKRGMTLHLVATESPIVQISRFGAKKTLPLSLNFIRRTNAIQGIVNICVGDIVFANLNKGVEMNPSKYLPVALLAAGLAWPQVSVAQSEGLYISGGVGAVFPRDSDVDGTGINSAVEFDAGPVGSLAIGSTLGGNWRGEFELSHREVDVDSVSGAAGSTGDLSGTALMMNGFYDFSNGSSFTPYVGAGIGPMRLDVDGATPFG